MVLSVFDLYSMPTSVLTKPVSGACSAFWQQLAVECNKRLWNTYSRAGLGLGLETTDLGTTEGIGGSVIGDISSLAEWGLWLG